MFLFISLFLFTHRWRRWMRASEGPTPWAVPWPPRSAHWMEAPLVCLFSCFYGLIATCVGTSKALCAVAYRVLLFVVGGCGLAVLSHWKFTYFFLLSSIIQAVERRTRRWAKRSAMPGGELLLIITTCWPWSSSMMVHIFFFLIYCFRCRDWNCCVLNLWIGPKFWSIHLFGLWSCVLYVECTVFLLFQVLWMRRWRLRSSCASTTMCWTRAIFTLCCVWPRWRTNSSASAARPSWR